MWRGTFSPSYVKYQLGLDGFLQVYGTVDDHEDKLNEQ